MSQQRKYEFTGETITHFGITLRRIRAVVAITSFGVSAGDLGGWIESEKNLSQTGNAWVSGNAMVSGNARVSGGARVYGNALVYGNARVTPVVLTGFPHVVTFTDTHIRVGCWFGNLDEWKTQGKRVILEDGHGKKETAQWHKIICLIAEAHFARVPASEGEA
jgi:hypothetical protein